MKHIDFVTNVAIAITTSVTPIIPAAETFGPLALGRLGSFSAKASKLSRRFRRLIDDRIDATILAQERAIVLFASGKRRDPEPKGISIYRVNAAKAYVPGDIDLIRDRDAADAWDRHVRFDSAP
jgi:hypothetical protein